MNRHRKPPKLGPTWTIEPQLRPIIARLRALALRDPDVMARRLWDATYLEAAGVDRPQLMVLVKVVMRGRFTGEDLVQLQHHGIGIQPVLDYVHRHYRPTEDQ